MQSYGESSDPRKSYFSKRIESVRKDIERAFGILQSRFYCLRKPSLHWDVNNLHEEVLCCIILHNMIVEDEVLFSEDVSLRGSSYLEYMPPSNLTWNAGGGSGTSDPTPSESNICPPLLILLEKIREYQEQGKFHRLREALTNNMYKEKYQRPTLLE